MTKKIAVVGSMINSSEYLYNPSPRSGFVKLRTFIYVYTTVLVAMDTKYLKLTMELIWLVLFIKEQMMERNGIATRKHLKQVYRKH